MKKYLVFCLVCALLLISAPISAAPLAHPILEEHEGPTDFMPGEMFSVIENTRLHVVTDNYADVYGTIEEYGFVTYGAWTYSVELELIFWCGGLTTITYGTSTGGFSWKAALFQFKEYITTVFPDLFDEKELDTLSKDINKFLESDEFHYESDLDLQSISGLSLILDKAIDDYFDTYLMICISLPDFESELYDYLYMKDYEDYYDDYFSMFEDDEYDWY